MYGALANVTQPAHGYCINLEHMLTLRICHERSRLRVSFVGVENIRKLVANRGVDAFLTGLESYMEGDFRQWNSFDNTPRTACHTPLGVTELMPTSDAEFYGFTFVNGHPSNPGRGYQTVTPFRTAATSAVAATFLACRDASVMAMIGAGSQAEFQAYGICAATGIRELRIWDIDLIAAPDDPKDLFSLIPVPVSVP